MNLKFDHSAAKNLPRILQEKREQHQIVGQGQGQGQNQNRL